MKQQLAIDLKSRDGDTGQDPRLVNAYVEAKRGIQFIVKRPSLEAALELPTGTGAFSTLGQALYVWQEVDVDSTTLTTSVVGIRGDRGKKTPDTKALLYFTTQPSNASLNTAISPSIVVTARDKFGNTKTDFTGNVTLSFATNRYAATLSGTLTVAAVAGVATFSNVTLNRSGIGFALRATATGAKPATSNTFNVPTSLVFTTLPSGAMANETFTVVVAARDTAGNTDTNYTGSVTIAINSGTGTLSGTKTVTAVSGVATFTGLSIEQDGTFTLSAVGSEVALVYPPASGVSNSFSIGGYTLNISVNTEEYNVYSEFVALYGAPPSDVNLNVVVASGVIITGSDVESAISFFGVWPGTPTFTLTLEANAQILGGGGLPGVGADAINGLAATSGEEGWAAIGLGGQTVSIDNGGYIFGGGGGGGGGGGIVVESGGQLARASGGGGGSGAGFPIGTGGGGAPTSNNTGLDWTIDAQATAGSSQPSAYDRNQSGATGGAGATISNTATPAHFATGGAGGNGGGYGQNGSPGVAASGNGDAIIAIYTPGGGGPAGLAIDLSGGSVTWISGNNATQVKGAVA